MLSLVSSVPPPKPNKNRALKTCMLLESRYYQAHYMSVLPLSHRWPWWGAADWPARLAASDSHARLHTCTLPYGRGTIGLNEAFTTAFFPGTWAAVLALGLAVANHFFFVVCFALDCALFSILSMITSCHGFLVLIDGGRMQLERVFVVSVPTVPG